MIVRFQNRNATMQFLKLCNAERELVKIFLRQRRKDQVKMDKMISIINPEQFPHYGERDIIPTVFTSNFNEEQLSLRISLLNELIERLKEEISSWSPVEPKNPTEK